MKKIILLIIPLLLLCGCEGKPVNEYSESSSYIGVRFTIYVDEDTCVEYFVSDGSYNTGDVYPRYNQDGSLKVNNKCMNDKESE